jgi:hypothetical protein
LSKMRSTWWPMMSCGAGALPREGTCTMSVPVSVRHSIALRCESIALRGEGDFARVSFDVGNEFSRGLSWERRPDHDHVWHRAEHADGFEFRGLEAKFLAKGVIDRDRAGRACQQHVAIGGRARNRLRSDVAAGSGPVLNDGLAPLFTAFQPRCAGRTLDVPPAGNKTIMRTRRLGSSPVQRPGLAIAPLLRACWRAR